MGKMGCKIRWDKKVSNDQKLKAENIADLS